MSLDLDYLNFVESHENYKDFNVFEKVLMASQRAKAIYEEEKTREEEQEKVTNDVRPAHKPTYQAVLEINEGKLLRIYETTKAPVVLADSSPIDDLSSNEHMTTPLENGYQAAEN